MLNIQESNVHGLKLIVHRIITLATSLENPSGNMDVRRYRIFSHRDEAAFVFSVRFTLHRIVKYSTALCVMRNTSRWQLMIFSIVILYVVKDGRE